MLISSLVQKYQPDSNIKQRFAIGPQSNHLQREIEYLITLIADAILGALILGIGLSSLFCGWLSPAASYSMIGVGSFYLVSTIVLTILILKNPSARDAYIKWVST